MSLDHAPARVEYAYDVRGNRIKERLLNASGVEIHADRFAFDSTGQMAWHHSSYEDNSFAHLFTYGRDAAVNLTNIVSSTEGGASTVLAYDALNRLASVSLPQTSSLTPLASYTYDNVGSLSAVNYANGIEHAYTYNALNRLTNLTHWVTDPVSSLKSQVSGYAYTLDARGYRTEILEASGRESHYTYDTLGRLTREYLMGDPTVANGAADYTYDKVGNRLSRTSSGFMPANQDFTYNENDWLDSDTYDSNGNTAESEFQVSGFTFQVSDVYDFQNRLIRRTYESGLILDYSYNARGTRIGKAKRIGGALVNRKLFVVDDQNLTGYVQTLEEWTAAGFDAVSLNKVYDYGLDLVSQTEFDPTAQSLKSIAFFCYDGHGSVRALADESGTITDTYTYDAFGIQLSQTGSTENAYRYCGEYYDSDLGLYYLRARHMNPETGRFHTLDEYEGFKVIPLSLHKYMYAHANPVAGIDPSGQFFLADIMTSIYVRGILLAAQYPGVAMGIRLIGAAANIMLFAADEEYRLALVSGFGPSGAAQIITSDALFIYHAASRALTSANIVYRSPHAIRFLQDSISPRFSDGSHVKHTVRALEQNGKIPGVPPIRIFRGKNGSWYTLDHRRLYCYKQANVNVPTVEVDPRLFVDDIKRKFTGTGSLTIELRKDPYGPWINE